MANHQMYGNLTLNLSLPLVPALLPSALGQPTHPRTDDASQLINELASHITTNLTCPGPVNTMLKCHINSGLATNDRHIIANAIETSAAEFAQRILEQFPSMQARHLAFANGARPKTDPKPPGPQLQPQTAGEYSVYLDNFVEKNLAGFYQPGEKFVQDLARKAASQAQAVSAAFSLPSKHTVGLAKLALYDFVILCDNSTSMLEDNRMPALQDTLERVAKFATVLNPDGISIRFLNHVGDGSGHFDRLRTVEDIKKMADVGCEGNTRLGEVLNEKIVRPMILEKATKHALKKPVIVVIITDGEPSGEPRESLRNTIRECKAGIEIRGYKSAATIFLISRVGTSKAAKKFLDELRLDKEVGHMVYSSSQDLNEKREAFNASGNDKGYTALCEKLIQLFLTALDRQTEPG